MSLPAFAATQPVESTLSVGVSNYHEADVPPHLVVGGDNRRYDVDIRQFRLLTPVGRNWSLGLDLSRETMSGASPWATVAGPWRRARVDHERRHHSRYPDRNECHGNAIR